MRFTHGLVSCQSFNHWHFKAMNAVFNVRLVHFLDSHEKGNRGNMASHPLSPLPVICPSLARDFIQPSC